MKYYKLTNQKYQTQNETPWGENITHTAKGTGIELCSADVIHVYDHPLKAAMFNSIHANITNPVLWECEVDKVVADDCLKVGVKSCTTIRQIPITEITTNQRVRFAILCALKVYNEKSFVEWANNWLSGKDRSEEAAGEARAAAWAAMAAWAAARAAMAAAWEAAGEARVAAWAAAEAARAAAWAAMAARAARAAEKIDFIALIEQAIRDEK